MGGSDLRLTPDQRQLVRRLLEEEAFKEATLLSSPAIIRRGADVSYQKQIEAILAQMEIEDDQP